MKLSSEIKSRQKASAFTLTEVMVSAVIFMAFFLAAMVAVQLYGLRVYTLAATKITATTDSREVLNSIRNGIRSCKVAYVGTYSGSTFTRISTGSPQIGNAVALYWADVSGSPSGNPTIYYQDSSTPTNTLKMVSTNGAVSTLLLYMTNYYCFSAEDYNGNVLSYYKNNPIIHMTLQFVQWQYPIGVVTNNGALDAYDYYRLQSRVSRRPAS